MIGRYSTVAGGARDTVDARGLNGLGEGHHRQDGGETESPNPDEHPMRAQRG